MAHVWNPCKEKMRKPDSQSSDDIRDDNKDVLVRRIIVVYAGWFSDVLIRDQFKNDLGGKCPDIHHRKIP